VQELHYGMPGAPLAPVARESDEHERSA
jgi:hypothetical protein